MDMRVQVKSARVGMQHRYRPGFALELPVVAAEGLHRRPGGSEQRRIDGARLPESQRPQFAGQGEGQQEILGWHLQVALAFQPLFALMVLTVRATSMSAGMRNEPVLGAVETGRQELRRHAAAAMRNGPQRLPPFRGDLVAVTGTVVGFMAGDDFCQPDHRTRPQSREKRCIRASMRIRADSLVWLVRWV